MCVPRKRRLVQETIGYCFNISWSSSKLHTIARMLCTVLPSALSIATALIGKRLLDLLSGTWSTHHSSRTVVSIFSLVLIFALLRIITNNIAQYCQITHDDMIRTELALQTIDAAISADIEYFDNSDYYNNLSSATRDSYEIPQVLSNIISCSSALVSFIIASVILARANVVYAITLILAGIPSALIGARYAKKLYGLSLSQMEAERQKGYIQHISTLKDYAISIRFFDAGKFLKEKYMRIWKELFDERKRTIKIRGILSGTLDCLPEAILVYIGLDVSFKVLEGFFTVGDYTLYSSLATQLLSSIYIFSHTATQIYDNLMKVSNYKSLSRIAIRVPNTGNRPLDCIETIDFIDVSFKYPGVDKETVSTVSFRINKGEKVVLVGLNGSGKSTLLKLLLRFYDVDSGLIKINGIDIREYRLNDIRKNFSVYFQNEPNYCFTLRENISLADDKETDDESRLTDAFSRSCAGDIPAKALKGYDTYLTRLFSNDGLELSGGENQKVALARAFFRRHTALILDEPTSNLDPEAEHRLFENLKHFSRGKTTLFTSHRLSNVSLADRIVVLEGGRVVEIGTQSELLRIGGRYAELYRYQQKKFLVEDEPNGAEKC